MTYYTQRNNIQRHRVIRMMILPFILVLGLAASAQGSAVIPIISTFIRTLLDDADQNTARTTLGVGTGNSPAFTGVTVTGDSVHGLNSSVFQPTTDSATFFQVLDADGGTPIIDVNTITEMVGIGVADPNHLFEIANTTGTIYPLYIMAGAGNRTGFVFDKTDVSKFLGLFVGNAASVFRGGSNIYFDTKTAYASRESGAISTNPALVLTTNNYVGVNDVSPLTVLDVNGTTALGNGFAANANNTANILNLIVGSNSDGSTNGISFHESVTPYAMKLGYDGTGSGVANCLIFYADDNSTLIRIQNGGGVFMYNLKSGTTQGGAGAATDELWVDTDDDNTIKLGS